MISKHIFEVTSKILKPLLKGQDEYFIALLENWSILLPKHWQNEIYPVKFKWISDTKAILIVKCSSNAQVINLTFECASIITKLNTFFGHKVITKIDFRTH